MDRSQKSPEESNDKRKATPSQDDTTKAPPKRTDAEIEEAKKEQKSEKENNTSVAALNSAMSSPTQELRNRRTSDPTFDNTGTNVSYEGSTSTAAGGTGYNSGQPATGARISSSDEYSSMSRNVSEYHEDDEQPEEKT
jgi:hypothetical protein